MKPAGMTQDRFVRIRGKRVPVYKTGDGREYVPLLDPTGFVSYISLEAYRTLSLTWPLPKKVEEVAVETMLASRGTLPPEKGIREIMRATAAIIGLEAN